MAPQMKTDHFDVIIPPFSPDHVHNGDGIRLRHEHATVDTRDIAVNLSPPPPTFRQSGVKPCLKRLDEDEENRHDLDETYFATSSSSDRGMKAKKKAVTFASFNECHFVQHLNEYSCQQLDDMWYTESEMRAIKRECIHTVHMMMQKTPMNEDDFCKRGLEYKTTSGSCYRRRNKQLSLGAVLDEQDLQRDEDCYNPDYLAAAYHSTTQKPKRVAHLFALRDERAVTRLTAEPAATDNKASTGVRSTSGSILARIDESSQPALEMPSRTALREII